MLAELKDLIRAIVAPLTLPAFYITSFLTVVITIFRRAEWGLYALIALIPLPNFRYQFNNYPLGKDLIDFFVFSILLGIFINKQGFKKSPNGVLLFVFILVNYVSLWFTSMNFSLPWPVTRDNPLLSDWKNYVEMIFLYFLVFNCVRDEKEQKIVSTIMATVILFIVVREFRNFSAGEAFSYEKRAEGPFWVVGLGANHLGAFIAHYSAVLLGLFIMDDHKQRRWLYLATVLIGIHPLFFSYSRGAYLAALGALAFFGVVKKRSLLAIIVVLVISWQTILPPTVVERITMTESPGGQLEESAAKRVELWNHAVGLFEANPVFGIGYGGFSYSVSVQGLTDTHNFYLRMLSEQGIIGVSLFVIILLAAFRSGWRLYRIGLSPYQRGLGLGFMGCALAATVTNLFGDRWSYFVLGGYFFVFWALVDRGIRLAAEPIPAPEPKSEQAPALEATNESASSAQIT